MMNSKKKIAVVTLLSAICLLFPNFGIAVAASIVAYIVCRLLRNNT